MNAKDNIYRSVEDIYHKGGGERERDRKGSGNRKSREEHERINLRTLSAYRFL